MKRFILWTSFVTLIFAAIAPSSHAAVVKSKDTTCANLLGQTLAYQVLGPDVTQKLVEDLLREGILFGPDHLKYADRPVEETLTLLMLDIRQKGLISGKDYADAVLKKSLIREILKVTKEDALELKGLADKARSYYSSEDAFGYRVAIYWLGLQVGLAINPNNQNGVGVGWLLGVGYDVASSDIAPRLKYWLKKQKLRIQWKRVFKAPDSSSQAS
jgi:hypothetical protein